MIGGTIVQIYRVENHDGTFNSYCVEVLDEKTFDRCWRRCKGWEDFEMYDHIWWQSRQGYLNRFGKYTDEPVGICIGSKHPETIGRSPMQDAE